MNPRHQIIACYVKRVRDDQRGSVFLYETLWSLNGGLKKYNIIIKRCYHFILGSGRGHRGPRLQVITHRPLCHSPQYYFPLPISN